MKASYFDFILIPALILNILLLVVAPVSQELLVPFSRTYNYSSYVNSYTYFNSPYLIDDRTPLASLPIPPTMDGLTYESYLIAQSFSSAATETPMFIPYTCPNDAHSCLYKNTSFVSTSFECSLTTVDEPIVNQTNYKETTTPGRFFSEFFPQGWMDVPVFFYAAEMLGRTHSDLKNYTAPTVPFFGPKGFIFDDYDPQYRPYVETNE
ncbi:hypothetical protein G6F56_010336 [Rhizopus delemar]|nr:hypothetical protein G6F56_010336 [Rhizopus delemar]